MKLNVITRYKNRKLYSHQAGGYVTLTEINRLIESGEEVVVFDKESDVNITGRILAKAFSLKEDVTASQMHSLIREGDTKWY